VEFSADGRNVVSRGADGTERVWDAADGSAGPVTPGRGRVSKANTVVSGRNMISGGADGTVQVWGMGVGAGLVMHGHTGPVRCVAVSADGRRIVSGGDDGKVRLWSMDGTAGPELRGHRYGEFVARVAISSDGRIVASGAKDGTVRVWDVDASMRGYDESFPWPVLTLPQTSRLECQGCILTGVRNLSEQARALFDDADRPT
jgi:WD40 repeat protein